MPKLTDETKIGQTVVVVKANSMSWSPIIHTSSSYWSPYTNQEFILRDLSATFGPSEVTISLGEDGFEARCTDPGLPVSVSATLCNGCYGVETVYEWEARVFSPIMHKAIHDALIEEGTKEICSVSKDRMQISLWRQCFQLEAPLDLPLSEEIWILEGMRAEEENRW